MNPQFSLLILEHKTFGQMLQPFLIEDEGKDHCTIIDRLAKEKLPYYGDSLSEKEVEIVETTNEYSEKNLAKRFSSKLLSARDFVNKVEPDYVERFVRPFIEKKMAACIAIAKAESIPVYYRDTKNVVYKSNFVQIEEKPAEIIFNFRKLPGETHYYQTISHNGETIKLKDREGFILTNDPCWLMLGQKLYHFRQDVNGNKLRMFFNKEFELVPARHEKKYYSTFVKKCLRDFPVKTEGIPIHHTTPEKTPLLSMATDFQGLPGLFLWFDYNEKRIKPDDKHYKVVNLKFNDGNLVFEVFNRDLSWEREMFEFLESNGLKHVREHVFVADDSQEKYNLIYWLNNHTEALRKKGFGLEQELAEAKYFTGKVEMTVKTEEKNDWFDVYAVARFGDDFEIPIIQLRNYLINGIREFKLPDGRIAILPDEWFSKYTDLITFGKKHNEKVRVRIFHKDLVSQSMQQTFTITQKILKNGGNGNKKEEAELPKNIHATLRSYQVEGFRWLDFLRIRNLGGCLADDMGLGKTLQTLTVIVNHINNRKAKNYKEPKVRKVGQIDLFDEIERQQSTGNPNLVVMPSSLIHNWQAEIQKFAPHLRHLNYTGPSRFELFNKITDADIVLTTYGTIRNDYKEFEKIPFDYIILDESQMIKNPTSKSAKAIYRLDAKHRLTLSGTPIENSLIDLWSQMHFLNPGLLGDLKFFRKYFATPIEKNADEEKQQKLHLLIKPFLLRRTKTQVEKELPELSEEHIYCEMTPEQQEIYAKEKISVRNFILQNIELHGVANSAIVMLQALTKLRQLANHPAMTEDSWDHGSGKFDEVIRNLETLISEGHKVLVFSSFVKHLQVFTKHFDANKMKYSLLTGQSRKRAEIIKEFQNDPERNVFFISLKAGGVGLNLTEAEYVFILDPWWNPQVENQAINRAHRIGQTRHVFAYRFITLGTIEEKIQKLQRRKSDLADLFIRSDNPLKEMNMEAIKDLID
jgi:SNF2 family DNA or RNA helicase